MSDHGKDDLEGVEAIPVYDRVTSRFEWRKRPVAAPEPPRSRTYGIEVSDENGNQMPFVANGMWVNNVPKT